jgi:hypothetical protein
MCKATDSLIESLENALAYEEKYGNDDEVNRIQKELDDLYASLQDDEDFAQSSANQ